MKMMPRDGSKPSSGQGLRPEITKDIHGDRWRVCQRHPTAHGFTVVRGNQYVEQQASKTGWMDAWEWIRQPRNAVDFAGNELAPAVDFQVRDGYAVLSTQLLVAEDDLFGEGFDRSVLKFEYWPDAMAMPALMVGAGDNGINYEIGRD